ncbi:MAG: glutamine-hydrolyzing carbamoyl-phosphate synthase small subunit [Candidatus Firestonebacteria bacterium]
MKKQKIALLALEDGLVFEGKAFGAEGEFFGEVVFNTSMTGYQEILTDPSYCGQIVTMTYPMIGNYGINEADMESEKPQVSGFVVKECSKTESNWRSEISLGSYLKKNNIIGIEGLDTRMLTKHLRTHGAKKGVISTIDLDEKRLVKKAKASQSIVGVDMVQRVTCKKTYQWTEPLFDYEGKVEEKEKQLKLFEKERRKEAYKVVLLDCGAKLNIMRYLVSSGCEVTVVPAFTNARDILAMNPDGVMLSNGPGDPEAVTYVIDTVRNLIGKKPLFGICLGHQMLGLALGGKTYKLKFGHRGGNQPVLHLPDRKVEITSQNHGFCVDMDSLPKSEVEVTHINLNDNTVEGFRHKKLPIFCVQYHPEASPGPHDASYLFKKFIESM